MELLKTTTKRIVALTMAATMCLSNLSVVSAAELDLNGSTDETLGDYLVTIEETENGTIAFVDEEGNEIEPDDTDEELGEISKTFTEGETVEIKMTGDEGYEGANPKILNITEDTTDTDIELTDGTFSFTMPASNVLVYGEFKEIGEEAAETTTEEVTEATTEDEDTSMVINGVDLSYLDEEDINDLLFTEWAFGLTEEETTKAFGMTMAEFVAFRKATKSAVWEEEGYLASLPLADIITLSTDEDFIEWVTDEQLEEYFNMDRETFLNLTSFSFTQEEISAQMSIANNSLQSTMDSAVAANKWSMTTSTIKIDDDHGSVQVIQANGTLLSTKLGVSSIDVIRTVKNNYTTYETYGYDSSGSNSPYDSNITALNCNNFVRKVLLDAGVSQSTEPSTNIGAQYIMENGITYRTYYSENLNDLYDAVVNDNSADSVAPGDIIWVWNTGYTNDTQETYMKTYGLPIYTSGVHHTGIYVGNYLSNLGNGDGTNLSGHYSQNGWIHCAGDVGNTADAAYAADNLSSYTGCNVESLKKKSKTCYAITVIKLGASTSDLIFKKDGSWGNVRMTEATLEAKGYPTVLGAEYTIFQKDGFAEGKTGNTTPDLDTYLKTALKEDYGGDVNYLLSKNSGKVTYTQTIKIDSVDGNGNAYGTFKNLKNGIYFVVETKAAKGYELDPVIYAFAVRAANGATSTADKTSVDNGTDCPVNIKKICSTGNFTTVDANGNKGTKSIASVCYGTGYSTSGAVFSLYTDVSCAASKLVKEDTRGTDISTITANLTGDVTPTIYLAPGTYYVKEVSAPKGYKLSGTVVSFTITADDVTNGTTKTVTFADEPVGDPIVLTLTKEGSDTADDMTAQFTVKYYGSGKESGTADATWVFQTTYDKTAKAYKLKMDKDHLVSGTLLYDSEDIVFFPAGLYTMEETKAPSGYTKTGTYVTYADGKQKGETQDFSGKFSWTETTVSNGNGGWKTQLSFNKATVSNSLDITLTETPKFFGFSMYKSDLDLFNDENETTQGNATSLVAEFEVVNSSGKTVWVDLDKDGVKDEGETFADNAQIMTFKTGKDGSYTSKAIFQAGGTYTVNELTPPTGYTNKGTTSVTIDGTKAEDGDTIALSRAESVKNEIIRGGFKFYKLDDETGKASAQGDANLQATFSVINLSGNSVKVKGKTYAKGEVVYTFTTDAETGEFTSASDLLPYGDYEIVETGAVKYTTFSKVNPGTACYFSITTDGDTVTQGYYYTDAAKKTKKTGILSIYDQVQRGGFAFQKDDAELADNTAQGNASLMGAAYSITNTSANDVYLDTDGDGEGDKLLKAGATLKNAFTTDKYGRYYSNPTYLPVGTYEITESGASEGYKLDTTVYTVNITKHGQYVIFASPESDYDAMVENVKSTYKDQITEAIEGRSNSSTGSGFTMSFSRKSAFTEQPVRGGFKFQKLDDETGKASAQGGANLQATFKVINLNKNSVKVKGKTYAEGEVVYTFTTDAKTGEFTSASDLLPYGDYEIVETGAVKYTTFSKVNPGLKCYFSIREDGEIADRGYYYTKTDKGGTKTERELIINDEVKRGGFAIQKNDYDLDDNLPQGDADSLRATVIDTVRYRYLIPGETYTLKGTLVLQDH